MSAARLDDAREGARDDAWEALLPDLTPLLDILFILLVFFVLTAGVGAGVLHVALPEAEAAAAPPDSVALELRRDGGYALDGRLFAHFEALQAELRARIAARPHTPLVIAADRGVAIERLVEALSWLRAEGLDSAGILIRDKPPS